MSASRPPCVPAPRASCSEDLRDDSCTICGGRTPLVVFRCSLRNTVRDALRAREGWAETDSDTDWDLNWANVEWIREHWDRVKLEDHQRVNHFRNHYEISRKDLLVKNIKRMRKQLEKADDLEEAAKFDFIPQSYVLPGDYSLFVEAFRKEPGTTWIMKPVGRAQGQGIFLFTKLSEISDWKRDYRYGAEKGAAGTSGGLGGGSAIAASLSSQPESYIVQKYIQRPYTIGGKKFDCRIYVLVTSYMPLTVWLYRDGFGRFSSTRYDFESGDRDNLYMHLTNVAIQKHSAAYAAAQGCKWNLHRVKMWMASKHGMPAVNKLFGDIQGLIVRSLLAVQPAIIHDRHAFELYGYDIIWDQDLKPWLLEVNKSPSMTADTDEDYRLKRALISDVLDVIDMEGRRRGDETRVGGFDMIYNAGPVDLARSSSLPPAIATPLGLFNPSTPSFAHIVRPTISVTSAAARATASRRPSDDDDDDDDDDYNDDDKDVAGEWTRASVLPAASAASSVEPSAAQARAPAAAAAATAAAAAAGTGVRGRARPASPITSTTTRAAGSRA